MMTNQLHKINTETPTAQPLLNLEAQAEVDYRVIQEVDALHEFEDAWDILADKSGSPMQYHAWAQCAATTVAKDYEVRVIVVGPPRQPTAIAPLVTRRGEYGRLELLGVDALHEPMDFLYADPSALHLLAQALLRMGCPLFLTRVPAESPVVEALRSAYRGRGLIICRTENGYPWVPLDASWTQPELKLNSGRRSDLRRARRAADKFGSVKFEIVNPGPEELVPLLEEAFRVEAAGWKGREGSALMHDQFRRKFYSQYAAEVCRKGLLRLCFMRIGGRPVAMQFAVESGNRFWLLKIGHDEAFERCSPGMLLILETLRYAATRELSAYEFLGSVESWTEMWTRMERPCLSLRAYPYNGRGMTSLAADACQAVWRKVDRLVRCRQ